MAYRHQRFHTEGSNALKAEELEFDVFVKPQFLSEHDQASIIDFDEAREGRLLSSRPYEWDMDAYAGQETSATRSMRLVQRLKKNRMFSGLFAPHNKNVYQREDLLVFAKGFSVTGVTAFIMILFGA